MDDFDDYIDNIDDFVDNSIEIDTDCLHNDFDDYDLFGERMEGDDNQSEEGNDILFE